MKKQATPVAPVFNLEEWVEQNKTMVYDTIFACEQCLRTQDMYKLLNERTQKLLRVLIDYWVPQRDALVKNWTLKQSHFDVTRFLLQVPTHSLVKTIVALNNKTYNLSNDDFIKFYSPESFQELRMFNTPKLIKQYMGDWLGKKVDDAEKKWNDRLALLSKMIDNLGSKNEKARRGELLTVPAYTALRAFAEAVFIMGLLSERFANENRLHYSACMYARGDLDAVFKLAQDIFTANQKTEIREYFVLQDNEKVADIGRIYGEKGRAMLQFIKTIQPEEKQAIFERVKKSFSTILPHPEKPVISLAQEVLDKLNKDLTEGQSTLFGQVLSLAHVEETCVGIHIRHMRFCAVLQEFFGVKKLEASHYGAAINTCGALSKILSTMMQKTQFQCDAEEKRDNYCDNPECLKQDPNMKLLRCSGCKLRRYCSSACQLHDWGSTHKHVCKKGSEMLKVCNQVVL